MWDLLVAELEAVWKGEGRGSVLNNGMMCLMDVFRRSSLKLGGSRTLEISVKESLADSRSFQSCNRHHTFQVEGRNGCVMRLLSLCCCQGTQL